MKKLKKVIALLGMAAILSSAFFSCKGNDAGESGGGNGGSTPGKEDITNDDSGIKVPEISIDGNFFPAKNAESAYEDGSLIIKFDSVPTVNRTGDLSVKIYNGETVVDTIKAADETLNVDAKNTAYQTINVKDLLISVNGNSVVIKPHASLENSKTYKVVVDSGLISGKIAGEDFAGVSDWSFTTRAAPTISGNEISIGADKDFSTVQAALNYIGDAAGDWTFKVYPGFYHERLTYSGSANVVLEGVQEGFDARSGEDGEVVIYWENANIWNGSTRQRAAVLWEGGDLTVKNLTIANTIDRADIGKDGTQAEALYYDAVGKIVAYNASFKSHQDTLLIGNNGGRGWFYQCYVEGDTDFIWGYPHTVLFEECQIRCLYDDAPAVTTHTSYIFASRAVETADNNKGLVLYNSNIKVDNGVTAYFGRNSGSDTQATVVFNTFEKIDSTLWFEGALPSKYSQDIEGVCTVGYKDFGNTLEDGSLINTLARREGTYELSEVVALREYNGRNAILNRGWSESQQKYVPCATQWDLSALETEFNASEDKSKSMIYVEPTFVPYLEGGASTEAFVAKDYKGTAVEGVTFVSSNTEAATVEGAVVTACEDKEEIVTVTATSGDMSGVARVVVIKQFIPATGLAFENTEAITIDKDDTCELKVVFTPADVTDSSVIWESSDTNVLRVVGNGPTGEDTSAIVTGFGKGTAKIIASSKKTPEVKTEIEITVKDVYTVSYLSEGTTYTKNASVGHRDNTVVPSPVSYGFVGDLPVADYNPADTWGNGGWKFSPVAGSVVTNTDGADFAWADFVIRAAGDIKLKSVSADLYCSATSNLRARAYVKVGDGEFVERGLVNADNKAMSFTKQDITTDVKAGETVTVRLAIATLEGKTVNKYLQGVIGSVVIYYDITGTAVPFLGADGTYNIIDYHTGDTSQWATVADGSSADGMVSWESLKYHSPNYGVAVSGSSSVGYVNIKVGGSSVIGVVGSQYGNGTLTVTNGTGEVIAGPVSTKMTADSSIETRTLSFLYTENAEDTIKLAFTGTSYIGPISVKELTTEVAEVLSVTINGADTVSTAAPSTFTATVETTYCASSAVVWASSDESIATVDETGKVTGLKAGTVTITATSVVDSTKTNSIEVTVVEEELKPVAGETYSYNFKDSSASDYVPVTAGVEGTSADSFLSWNNLWKTHSYGLVNGVADSTISIKVAGDVLVGFTGYNSSSGSMKVTAADGTVVLENMPMATGNDATTKWFIYKGGETTLTLTSLAKDCYISTITVKPWTNEVPAVTAIALKGASSVTLGNTITLTADVTREYFADDSVIWASEDTSIATVENGIVTGVAAGSVSITATSVSNPEIVAAKIIKVEADAAKPAYGMTYSYALTGGVGSPYTSDDSFLNVVASSDNGGHGLVMKDGNTVKIKVGGDATVSLLLCQYDNSATVTLTASDGTIIATKDAVVGGTCGAAVDFEYAGNADELTFTWSKGQGGNYLHGVKVTY